MKNILLIALLVVGFCVPAAAQRISKPTLTPKACTPDQKAMVQEGIAYHDARKYDAAVEKYEQVLSQNPDCTIAIYELSMTLYTKGDKTKAMETAYRGSSYKSDELPLFYLTMANIIDDVGKPEEAVRIYKDAIKILEDDKSMRPHLSSLQYNLGITLIRQEKLKEAAAQMKNAVVNNYSYASPHYMLSELYFDSSYRYPAVLAAARFVAIEYNTERSQRAAKIIHGVLGRSAAKADDSGKITVTLGRDGPTDEGDFGGLEMILGLIDAGSQMKDKPQTKGLSDEEKFAGRIEALVTFLDGDKKNKATFVAQNYLPFMKEMKARGFVKPFAYIVLANVGNPEGLKWLGENKPQMVEFLAWAKSYQPL